MLVHVPPDASGAATPPDFGNGVMVTVRFDSVSPSTGAGASQAQPPPAQPTANACDTDGEAGSPTPANTPTLKLTQTERTVDQPSVTSSGLAGVVQAVCPGSRQLVLSADDTRESGQDSVLQVARGIDLNRVPVGRAITATVELKPPDLLSLGSLASDQGMRGANSQKQVQGSSGTSTGTGF